MTFVVDEMLGKLARWMRMEGWDVFYERRVADDILMEKVRREGMILLTRDTHLIERLKPQEEYLFITKDHLEDQFQEVLGRFSELLKEQKPFSRCVECNTLLEKIEKEAVKDKVWPYVYSSQQHFTTCPTCHRIYWQATHVNKIRERLKTLVSS